MDLQSNWSSTAVEAEKGNFFMCHKNIMKASFLSFCFDTDIQIINWEITFSKDFYCSLAFQDWKAERLININVHENKVDPE